MGKFLKKTLLIVSVLAILLTVGCSGGIRGEEAKKQINEFLDAVEAENYELASTFLHPERPADLKTFFESLKNEKSLDFSSGVEIVKYTGFSSSYYDSTVDGSTYTLAMKGTAGEQEFEMQIEIVRNDNGYGIYNLYIDT